MCKAVFGGCIDGAKGAELEWEMLQFGAAASCLDSLECLDYLTKLDLLEEWGMPFAGGCLSVEED